MLNPAYNRLDYGCLLSAPEGYKFDQAVATTYSLDLHALLAIPLALRYGHTLEGDFNPERFELLEAIESCAKRLVIFHQQGQIHVPDNHNRLLAFLEPALCPVVLKDAYRSFHPKFWLLRYNATVTNQPVKYRLLVMSRNLTNSRDWDVSVALDAELTDRAQTTWKNVNEPLVGFLEYLKKIQTKQNNTKTTQIPEWANEISRLKWTKPEGVVNITLDWRDEDTKPTYPLEGKNGQELLCISPFIHEKTIEALSNTLSGNGFYLLGRGDQLQAVASKKPGLLDDLFCSTLTQGIIEGEHNEGVSDDRNPPRQQNLHAKLYVLDEAHTTTVLVTSANATEAAHQRNVELGLQLVFDASALRVQDVLASFQDGKFRLFEPWQASASPEEGDQQQRRLRRLRQLRHQICALNVYGRVDPEIDNGTYTLTLNFRIEQHVGKHNGVSVRPFCPNTNFKPLNTARNGKLVFKNMAVSNITQFLEWKIPDGAGGDESFLTFVRIDEIPDSRLDRIVQAIVGDKDGFIRYLSYLLADDLGKARLSGATKTKINGDGPGAYGLDFEQPLLEQLFVAKSREPQKLDDIERLLERLESSRIVPDEFSKLLSLFRNLILD